MIITAGCGRCGQQFTKTVPIREYAGHRMVGIRAGHLPRRNIDHPRPGREAVRRDWLGQAPRLQDGTDTVGHAGLGPFASRTIGWCPGLEICPGTLADDA